ncbi:undecaprenyldiphospho-muramoylpentapeptide beta-N-acetylglucosaminyltransferase [Candidatus Aquicultor secundus]|uniref:UDP-N-acetylglucosamine--N-acetylmuramyl-(pentapeptide) pyrophosphoryl-undecaprenol N-acetylglucosamine transferase n=1 Tax=Candidatus Aquicultor secundus TaxID=1973895 RepID=A0A2M7T9N3_9ACTN|nr:undecaprenyldiphospho-muramoylpentapeptide beta-N-acetylglucosaminyltransferase [Candidatus Aquicultor secundus]PIZ41291.1 MAG: undecaprenyldiphospho-muramoylpentapeptide beta-N-acetylglucosaminyltransferase [Candidatus Aquicultor secundus]
MRVIISGGGTAGHVYPGLALAKALQKARNDLEILFVGTSTGLEATLVPQAGFDFKAIEARGLPRKPSFKALVSFISAGRGTIEAVSVFRRFKPDVVVGMGAYVSLPVVGGAVLRQIPTVIHEQNAVPGLVNKVLGRVVGAIAVSYPDMRGYFPADRRVEFTGNPIREEILSTDKSKAKQAFDVNASRRVLLVFGGSRGAKKINEAVVEAYDRWRHNDGLQIIHATGKINYESVQRAIDKIKLPEDKLKYTAYPYLDNMGEAYAAADLLVCRSGATTVAEITAIGLPAIMVPYPYATDNHQEKNGRELERLGAARLILDKDLDGVSLSKAVDGLILSEDALLQMAEASRQFGRPDADKALADLVFEIAESRKHSTEK